MEAVNGPTDAVSPIGRLAWLVAGGLWAARSLIGFQNPEYWNPVTTLDFVSIWLFSACFLALAMFLIARLAPVRAVYAIAAVVALTAVGAGIANGAEDGLDVRWAGTLYVLGSLTTFFGTLALGIALEVEQNAGGRRARSKASSSHWNRSVSGPGRARSARSSAEE